MKLTLLAAKRVREAQITTADGTPFDLFGDPNAMIPALFDDPSLTAQVLQAIEGDTRPEEEWFAVCEKQDMRAKANEILAAMEHFSAIPPHRRAMLGQYRETIKRILAEQASVVPLIAGLTPTAPSPSLALAATSGASPTAS